MGLSAPSGVWSLPVRGAWIEMVYESCTGQRCRSLPVRGAWIEILQGFMNFRMLKSLPVRGAWIEMCSAKNVPTPTGCRSPCGERGLKLVLVGGQIAALAGRSPCGERGLKSSSPVTLGMAFWSLPVRGAWIEIMLNASLT